MEEFSSANQSRVVLLDENGGIVREWNGLGDADDNFRDRRKQIRGVRRITKYSRNYGKQIISRQKKVFPWWMMEQQAMGRYEVALKEQIISITLFVFGSYLPCELGAVEALGQILPWMLLTVFAVSLLIRSFLFQIFVKASAEVKVALTKWRPDFSSAIDMKRIDEIGFYPEVLTMAESSDQASIQISLEANAKLKDEMEQERKLEQQRMEFCSSVP